MDYVFTIIEDNQVPLSGNFNRFSYAPVVAVVVISLVLLAILAYALWIESHIERVIALSGNDRVPRMGYFFHPVKLLREESELEYSLVNVPARS